ncbi:MAG: elongation factor Ts [Solirubrobacteraceae bacterium]
MAEFTAKDVAALRQKTGAGMMDCKNALTEAGGDQDKALEALKVKMGKKLGKLADREAAEGTVQSYIHATGKVGVIVEVDCNTDFVARNDDFIAFARDVAMHVAASPTVKYVKVDDVPQEDKDAELRVFVQQAEAEGKPENIREKIATGKLNKWLEEIVLAKQVHVNADKPESETIDRIRAQLSNAAGENVLIRRFARFAVGE